ncbi:hypothetical protein Nepgr_025101 [Nepenthes gracilis]|uniref:Protein kinase domain-containing protein n=1 Tax=Nepenthes gracilis TaxID=150966 RepID=A0AAD3T5K3_NEPGR|nr:hypothetical protein Nepgr_025101 [Nepenthes gracilis]
MEYVRSGSFRRLFSILRRGGFEEEEEESKECLIDEDKNGAAMGGSGTEQAQRPPTWKCFSYKEIFLATNGFSSDNLVGKGGHAEVYKGILSDGETVAVKKLIKESIEERREREFLTEIGTIGHVFHRNVSLLLGICIDNGLFLIFPFSPNGSVASRLHDGDTRALEWEKRFKIAIGTAQGLHYLHKGCQRRIIHRDIKASNILLDEDFEPQISDFGLAKWLPTQWTHHSLLPIEGTVGYLAPEYFSHGIVDEKTDVFAFGVFLLELISGKRPVDAHHRSLRTWAEPLLKKGEIEKLVDPKLGGAVDHGEVKRLAFAASLCIRASSIWRPAMGQVLEIMASGDIDRERWEMPEKEERQENKLWGFEDLEFESDTSFSTSLPEYSNVSTGSC